MTIYPRPGQTGEALQRALTEITNSSRNAASGPSVIDSYLKWVTDAVRICRLVMTQADLDRLITTPRYWATLASPTQNQAVYAAVHDELLARKNDLDAALADLRQTLYRWNGTSTGPQAVVVPDTNVLLEHPQEIDTMNWHDLTSSRIRIMDSIRIVVPLLIVDELDNAKRVNRTRSRARVTLKKLYSWFSELPSGRWPITDRTRMHGDVTVELVLDDLGHVRLPRPDDELIDRARGLGDLIGHKVSFLTYDTGAALRAQASGLVVHHLDHRNDGQT